MEGIMDSLIKALNDKTRREILDMLKEEDLTAGEIAKAFKMTKPSISHHLDLLKRAELVDSTKKGQFVHYSFKSESLTSLHQWVEDLILN